MSSGGTWPAPHQGFLSRGAALIGWRTPRALAAVDAWAEGTLAGGARGPEGAAVVRASVDALLGVRL